MLDKQCVTQLVENQSLDCFNEEEPRNERSSIKDGGEVMGYSTKATISPLTTFSPCFPVTATILPSRAGTISSRP